MDVQFNLKFLSKLEDPEQMINWCMTVGLIGNKYVCPKCKNAMKLCKRKHVSDNYVWRCHKSEHDVIRSVRRGSWFENSKLSMHDILLMTYMWCLKVPSESIMSDLNVSSHTVVDWTCFCREVCVEMCVNENEMLGGEDIIVEIDESRFGNRKYQRGKMVSGSWVFGGIERGTNKCFMKVVPERSKNGLLNVIRENVRPGSIIISDCWQAYDSLEDEDFIHLAVSHNYIFKDPEIGEHANSLEGTWGAIKCQLNLNHCKWQFDTYLFEYMWRRRHQDEKQHLMMIFLEAIRQIYVPNLQDD